MRLIARVRHHPALYDYYITDEPSATNFAALGKLVAYLRERDPAHLAYINLFPTYASNEQLGTKGDTVTAYREHLRQYVDIVKPGLISYDHYQLAVEGDRQDYFLNLAMIRRAAQDAGLPFLNIVQAATWDKSMRVPTGDEVRYLDLHFAGLRRAGDLLLRLLLRGAYGSRRACRRHRHPALRHAEDAQPRIRGHRAATAAAALAGRLPRRHVPAGTPSQCLPMAASSSIPRCPP